MNKKNNGFSLVSTLVAVGILGVASLGLMKLSTNMTNVGIRSQEKGSEVELQSLIRMIINNQKYCEVSLAVSPINDFTKTGVDFGGANIDESSGFDSSSEGINVELWYSDSAGNVRTKKKLNGADNPGGDDKSDYGNLQIETMKLVMNNGAAAYTTAGLHSDTGDLVVVYSKKVSTKDRSRRLMVFPINVSLQTNTGTNISTIEGCVGPGGSSLHVPTGAVMAFHLDNCPTGWAALDGTGGRPDMGERFVRGWDGTVGLRGIPQGSVNTLARHSHAVTVTPNGTIRRFTCGHNDWNTNDAINDFNCRSTSSTAGYTFSGVAADAGVVGGESLPRHINYLYCIKT